MNQECERCGRLILWGERTWRLLHLETPQYRFVDGPISSRELDIIDVCLECFEKAGYRVSK